MNDFGSKIYDAAKKAVKEVYDLEPAEGQLIIETPQDTKLGDYSTSIAMKLSRTLRRNPMEIAEPLTAKLAELLPECESITVAPMPQPDEIDGQLLARFELAREVISSVRNVRNQKNLPQKEALTLKVIADENYPAEYAPVMRKMANLTAVETVTEKDPAAAAFIVKTTQYFVPMAGKIDAEAERRKLTDELSYQEGFLASVMKKLSNERFMQSAPEKVVANERAKQADAEAKIAALREQLAALK